MSAESNDGSTGKVVIYMKTNFTIMLGFKFVIKRCIELMNGLYIFTVYIVIMVEFMWGNFTKIPVLP